MTTATARTTTADVRTESPTKAAPLAAAPSSEDTFGAWLVTAMIATFFLTAAFVFWMAHTVQV